MADLHAVAMHPCMSSAGEYLAAGCFCCTGESYVQGLALHHHVLLARIDCWWDGVHISCTMHGAADACLLADT
jgi:hypothetical protein